MLEGNSADQMLEKIRADIRGQIDSKVLLPGAKLPSEAELSRRYMVNRYVIRRAFKTLENEGLIDSSQGRGRFVRHQPVPMTLERHAAFPFSAATEHGAYRSETRTLLKTRAPSHIVAAMGLNRPKDIFVIERLLFLDDVPIGIARQHVLRDRFPDFEDAFKDHGGSVSRTLASAGVSAYERSDMAINARLPSPEECCAIHMAAHTPLFILSALCKDRKGAFDYHEIRFSSDRIELRLAS